MSSPATQPVLLVSSLAGLDSLRSRATSQSDVQRIIDRCIKRISFVVEGHGGWLMETANANICAVFPDGSDALSAALAMRDRVEDMLPVGGQRLSLNIGIDLWNSDEAYIRPRILAWFTLLSTHPLMVAADAVSHIPADRLHGRLELDEWQDKALPEGVFHLTPPQNTLIGTPTHPARIADQMATLRIKYHGEEHVFAPEQLPLTIGRDRANTLVVRHARASRVHASIDSRSGLFIIKDSSSNGTFLTSPDGSNTVLHQREILLPATGQLRFGHDMGDPTLEPMLFSVEYEPLVY